MGSGGALVDLSGGGEVKRGQTGGLGRLGVGGMLLRKAKGVGGAGGSGAKIGEHEDNEGVRVCMCVCVCTFPAERGR